MHAGWTVFLNFATKIIESNKEKIGGTLGSSSRHTSVPQHNGWETLAQGIIYEQISFDIQGDYVTEKFGPWEHKNCQFRPTFDWNHYSRATCNVQLSLDLKFWFLLSEMFLWRWIAIMNTWQSITIWLLSVYQYFQSFVKFLAFSFMVPLVFSKVCLCILKLNFFLVLFG